MNNRESQAPIKRTVLLLNINQTPFDWHEHLLAFNWLGVCAKKTSESIKHIKTNNIKVAIALISVKSQNKIFQTIDKINHEIKNLKWIGIFVDDCFSTTAISNVIGDYFTDFYHSPVQWDKLFYSLGHLYGMTNVCAAEPYVGGNTNVKSNTNARKKNKAKVNNQEMLVEFLGESKQIKNLKIVLQKVAKSDSAILIGGETGTGKDLCAHIIHRLSKRHSKPFITVNCAALPPSLVHSELFGHEKGSYTGANTTYIGHIERAHQGTLFLDEIGDLSLELQVNLLQFLETHLIERIGGSKPIQIDCRVIAASHVDLENSVLEGNFREDLFHRLNIIKITAPSLREHRQDIELLANHYLQKLSNGKQSAKFAPCAIEAMFSYDWPGNVRELKNRIERATVLADNTEITVQNLGISQNKLRTKINNLQKQRVEIDPELLLAAINRNNHNVSAAARELKISRTTFYRLIKKSNIKL